MDRVETPKPDPCAADEESSHIGGDSGGCPVAAVVVLVVLLPIVLCVGAATAMLTEACDSGLHETRTTGRESVENCFDTSLSWLEAEAGGMLSLFSVSVRQLLMHHLHLPKLQLNETSFLIHDTALPYPLTFAYIKTLGKPLYVQLKAALPTGIRGIYVHTAANESFGFHNFNDSTPIVSMATTETDPALMYMGYPDPITGLLSNTTPTVPLQLTELPMFAEVDAATSWDHTVYKWSPLMIMDGYLGISLLGRHPSGVAINILVTIHRVEEFLKQVAEAEFGEGAKGRLYTVVAGSWLADYKRDRGEDDWEMFNDKGMLAGVSSGRASKIDDKGEEQPVLDVEAEDDVIRGIAKEINGRYSEFAANKSVRVQAKIPSGDGTTTTVTHIASIRSMVDGFGLNWWLVTTVDLQYVLGRVHDLQTVVHETILENESEVNDRVRKHRLVSISVTVAGSAVMILLITWATFYLLIPVRVMQLEMTNVADMRLEAEGVTATSSIKEIKRMQRDFLKMIANLREYRAYVPAAILAGEAEIEPPIGEVTIVFTDIEGSTSLWKENAPAMNTAMEMHNDIIRKVYKGYDGYEVKTIGDSFMLAFGDPSDAVRTCMEILERFASQKWPLELSLPSGLRVRMGMHTGQVIAEDNPLTSRIDYRGSTVNLASRLEGKAAGASLCVTESVKNLIEETFNGRYKVTPHGTHELKGLGTGFALYLVHPVGGSLEGNGVQDGWVSGDANSTGGSGSGSLDRAAEAAIVAVGVKKTGLSLVAGNGTVAVCRLRRTDGCKMFENANLMIRAAVESAYSTDGSVGSLTGDSLNVYWNCGGSKNVTLHLTHGLRFSADLERRVGLGAMTVGVGTGKVQYGNVGTRKSRFQAVFGLPVELAGVSAELAENLCAFCVVSDSTAKGITTTDPTLNGFMRIVDRWRLVPPHDLTVTFYHLLSDCLSTFLHAWDHLATLSDPPQLAPFTAAVSALLLLPTPSPPASPLDVLKTLALSYPEDTVIAKVHEMLSSRGSDTVPTSTLSRLP
eukprot:TRINITY_DN1915_c0_g2_i3.p1 TRINITY_DN1915_c0_g2~~TRINITY_DN1915_c0_g2_i3.p1  ORF type:complete len:1034 (+),score=111.96 TRINITY_DN1915_c0_g2_i3:36-3104(+)